MRAFFSCLLVLSASFAFADSFEVYVSDAGKFQKPPWQILKFDDEGKTATVFIKDNLNWPQDIMFLEVSNTVLISNLGSGRITKHNAATGEFIEDFASSIDGPTRMKVGPDGLLYVLQWKGNGKVRRYEMSGKYVDEFTSVGVPQSIGLDWDSDGNLYVSSYTGDLVRKFDSSGNDQGIFINSNLAGPTNIWFDADGTLLVSDYDGTAIKRFDSSGKYMGDFIKGTKRSEGVDYLPDGSILIGDGGSRTVKMFDAKGKYVRDFVSAGQGDLLIPNAVRIRKVSQSTH